MFFLAFIIMFAMSSVFSIVGYSVYTCCFMSVYIKNDILQLHLALIISFCLINFVSYFISTKSDTLTHVQWHDQYTKLIRFFLFETQIHFDLLLKHCNGWKRNKNAFLILTILMNDDQSNTILQYFIQTKLCIWIPTPCLFLMPTTAVTMSIRFISIIYSKNGGKELKTIAATTEKLFHLIN